MPDHILGPLLAKIHSPEDVQALPAENLPRLAQDIRDELISVLSKTGGHLGPNLGVVELTIALHRVFNTPKDKFVFDVSHQGYVHAQRFRSQRRGGGQLTSCECAGWLSCCPP
jgi:deoxyxylulose-5-phosphate synthase